MHNLERTVYRIRCLTRLDRSYFIASKPFEQISDWFKGGHESILRALILESGISPFVSFGMQGHVYNTRTEAESAVEKLIIESSALISWAKNPTMSFQQLQSMVNSNEYLLPDNTYQILSTEYVIDTLIVPASEVMLSAMSQLSDSDKAWYVCVHYIEKGFSYYSPCISDMPEDAIWVKEENRKKAWSTQSEQEAIKLAKKIARSKDMTIYAFPRYLDKPLVLNA